MPIQRAVCRYCLRSAFIYTALAILAFSPGVGLAQSRITDDLAVLYTFGDDPNVDSTVDDVSDVGSALDLTIESPDNASRTLDDGLLIGPGATRVSNPSDYNKIYTACTAVDELTVEAWVAPDNISQGGPARIVTLSLDPYNRNFTLAQGNGVYEVRLRTTTNGLNGYNVRLISGPVNANGLQHVVFTRDDAGNATLYVDGIDVNSALIGGDFSNWDPTYDFALANEFSTSDDDTARDWLGEYALVAVYCKALTLTEVQQNYDAGLAGTECSEDADCDDDAFCNGAETCDLASGVCQAGTPPACDNGVFCDGAETCNEGTDSCDPGTPPDCDDGVSCTADSCNVGTDSCGNVPDNAVCDNNEFCDGAETCDAVLGCQAGIDPCPGESCEEHAAGPVCFACLVDGDCGDGLYCNGDETCTDGTCQPGAPVVCAAGDICNETIDSCELESESKRVTDGIEVLYTFGDDPTADSTVDDVSGVGSALDLTIETPGNTTLTPDGGLLIGPRATRVSNPSNDNKIYSSCTAAKALTVEAWVAPGTTSQGGPARIVTQSLNSGNRNFTLAQGNGVYEVRLRTTTNGLNGYNVRLIGGPVNANGLQHVVFTRDDAGNATLYVDGIDVNSAVIGGDFSNWDPTYDFALANEFSTSDDDTARDWLGEYALVAVYCKALTLTEVQQNYDAGLAGTECSEDADCDDDAFCNGAETCDLASGVCQAGTPPACDNGVFCDGAETCNEGTDSCDPGTPPDCDDGVSCTADSCNVGTDSCGNVPDNAVCDNNEFCDGAETCDAVLGCQAGIDPCPGESCEEHAAGPVCFACLVDGDCGDGLYCNGDETCTDGTCQPGAPVVCAAGDICNETIDSCELESESKRVTDGIEVLYTFGDDPTADSTVDDVSGVGSALDLTIETPGNTTLTPDGGLLIGPRATRVSNPSNDNKIYSSCTAAKALTVEAWVAPGTTSQGGPARIVTQSLNSGNRNFTLAQGNGVYEVRLRTTTNGLNGYNVRLIGGPVNANGLQHVVFTRDDAGNATLYVDGIDVNSAVIGGDFSNWDPTYDFALANEFSTSDDDTARDWLGEYALVAVYCKALTLTEVQQNYDAGLAGTECSEDADCDDDAFCNGAETCDLASGVCQAGTPPACDNGVFCDGAETCNESTDSCDPGTPPDCDDGVSCTADSCNVGTDSCDNVPDNAVCDNNEFCDGVETCDAVLDCQAGIDPCPGESCEEHVAGPMCFACLVDGDCGDGLYCNGDETCTDGTCQPGTPVDCAAEQICNETIDSCESEVGDPFNFVFLGSSTTNLSNPHDIKLSPDRNRLFVSDVENDRVVVLDADTLEFVAEWGSDHQDGTHDIDFDDQGRAYVADTFNNRVTVYDIDPITSLGVLRPENQLSDSSLSKIEGVLVHPNGRVYATGIATRNLVVFQDGEVVGSTLATEVGGLFNPHDVEVAVNGDIWLADSDNDRMLLLDPITLEVKSTLSGSAYRFNGVRYQDVRSDGTLIVADKDTHSIKIISSSGELLQVLGTENTSGLGDAQFTTPEGVEVFGNVVWFSDSGNDRIVKYWMVDSTTNAAPLAQSDAATVDVNAIAEINVLSNDIDEDTLLANPVIVDNPTRGSVVVDMNTGLVSYTPDDSGPGTDSFTYTIEDNSGVVSNIAKVTITIISVNDPPTGDRVTAGLQALYSFDAGSGNTVADISGVGTPLNLTIANATNTTNWGNGTLNVTASTTIASLGAATKLNTSIEASNAITVEAWIAPANTTQTGPARIVSVSESPSNRNVTLGQGGSGSVPGTFYNARLRTTSTGGNGNSPSLSSAAGTLTPAPTHVVYTRDAAGTAVIYINNAVAETGLIDGNFSNWAAGYGLVLGNEQSGDRPWLGTFDLVAIYDRALSVAEIDQNFNAGSHSGDSN